jgi:hypothetical protein
MICDVTYEFDSFGRRPHPAKRKSHASRFALLNGGSFVFGEGLQPQETLAFRITQSSHRHYAYNYGLRGTGTNSVLGLVKFTDLASQIQERQGVFVYGYLHFRLQRANGFLNEMRGLELTPVFEKEDDHMRYMGPMKKVWWFSHDYLYPTVFKAFNLLGV